MTYEEFSVGWQVLCHTFQTRELTEQTAAVWWSLLEPMPNDWFCSGIRLILATHRFNSFPTPAQLVDVLKDDNLYWGVGLTPAEKLERYREDMKAGRKPGSEVQHPLARDKEELTPEQITLNRKRLAVVLDVVCKRRTVQQAETALKRISAAQAKHV